MCFIATIVRPLRSKRPRISPVRRRAKASGLTRISVRSMRGSPVGSVRSARRGRALTLGAGRALDGARVGRASRSRRARAGRGLPGLPRRGRTSRTRAASLGRGRLADLGLAIGTDLPSRVERLGTDAAGLLEASQAARTAQEVALHLEAAVLAVL